MSASVVVARGIDCRNENVGFHSHFSWVKINAYGSNGSNLNLSIQHALLELLVALEDALDSYLFIRRLVQGGMAFTECAPGGRKKA